MNYLISFAGGLLIGVILLNSQISGLESDNLSLTIEASSCQKQLELVQAKLEGAYGAN